MSKILANQIANYGDNSPIEIKEGLNIPAGKPIQAAGVAGTSGQVLSSTASSVQWVDVFDGNYFNLTNKPSIPAAQVNSDWDATGGVSAILNKPVVPALPSIVTAAASTTPSLSYNSVNGEFTYTPPNLASYATQAWVGEQGYLTSLGTALVDGDFTSNGLMARLGAGTYIIVTDNSSDWNTAFGWGDHSSAGYLTSLGDAAGVTTAKITNWDTAFGWGNHASAGYLSAATSIETLNDVVFATAPSNGQVLKYDGSNWIATTDLVGSGGSGIILSDLSVTNASASGGGSLAYNNALGVFTFTPPNLTSYLTTETDPVFAASDAATITASNISNWDAAYGWGNHASGGYMSDLADDGSPELGGNLDMGTHIIQANGGGITNTNIGTTTGYFPGGFGNFAGTNTIGWKFDGNGFANCRADGPNSDGTAINALEIGNFTDLVCLTIDGTGALETKASLKVIADSGTTGTGSKITVGANEEFEIFHSSNGNSILRSTSGVFAIQNNQQTGTDSWDKALQLQAYGDIQLRFMGGGDAVYCKPGAEVLLYHASSPKLETHADGVKINGSIVDKNGSKGTSGQVLTSDGTELVWGAGGGGGGASVTIADTAPAATAGDLWWESDKGRLKIYYQDVDSSQWVDVSPPLSQITTEIASGSNKVDFQDAVQLSSGGPGTDNCLVLDPVGPIVVDAHILPLVTATYDIGSAERKIRDIFEDQGSDVRIKEDFEKFIGGLDFINSLEVVNFTYKDMEFNGTKAGKRETGLIAQNVKDALDKSNYESYRLWNENPDSYQGLDKKQLIPALVNAIQELNARVDDLFKELEHRK